MTIYSPDLVTLSERTQTSCMPALTALGEMLELWHRAPALGFAPAECQAHTLAIERLIDEIVEDWMR
jgi:hypothetical protein